MAQVIKPLAPYPADTADTTGATPIAMLSGLTTTMGGVLCDKTDMVVLLTAQADPAENGPIYVKSGAWVRAYPATTQPAAVLVKDGTNHGIWTSDVPDWTTKPSTWTQRM